MAARGGSGEVFQQALKILEELYTDDQVRAVYIFGVDILKTEGIWGGSIAFFLFWGMIFV